MSDGKHIIAATWPPRPEKFPDLMTSIEAAMYLRLDEIGQSQKQALRNLKFWRDRGELRATRYVRNVWFLRSQLDKFLENKTEI
ncbi:hypothetical protein SMSP2_01768 [Limihaloglobus sulfuriphilus]|uniref:DNA-binding protein n=1 Tax=Limihaloglobus sulfuriphilus TaxID=1851148 RepID=A0A1Q2MFH1_9BACT|nr:helix-turn-helix domain-containing protein [Limihaloglobus sulfuriphilus]AQQ71394.1 hypothetical protein SMSP2_01768 [Limihaloglobus sulfuriphilus]